MQYIALDIVILKSSRLVEYIENTLTNWSLGMLAINFSILESSLEIFNMGKVERLNHVAAQEFIEIMFYCRRTS